MSEILVWFKDSNLRHTFRTGFTVNKFRLAVTIKCRSYDSSSKK